MKTVERQRIFETWLSKHKGLLFKVVRAYAFNSHDQDDLFQEITFQLWKSVPGYREEVAETTWLYRVSIYTAISWNRKEKNQRNRRRPLNGSEHQLIVSAPPADHRLDWLYEQIAALDEMDRSLTLLMLEGLTYREIANTLGISETNVGVKLHRIKTRLVGKSKEEVRHGL